MTEKEALAQPPLPLYPANAMGNGYTADQLRETVAAAVARERKAGEERVQFTKERWEIECNSQVQIEREACANVVGDFAKKWWSIHCDTETTRKAHDDFCALQAAIRARGLQPTQGGNE